MTLQVTFQHRFADFGLDIDFEAPVGVTVLFGRSGSGKTTVANAVAGLLRPDQGRITLDGETLFDSANSTWLPPHQRRVGYVFQEGRLFPHLNVEKNLRYGSRFRATAPSAMNFETIVGLLGIGSILERRPANLSGGEKQRVAIGRALLSAPQLLVMDEPLASLDDLRKAEILPYLARLRDEVRIPILYVSHSVAEVARLATTVVTMADGRVTKAGPVSDVLTDPEIAPSLGVREAGAVIEAVVARHHVEDGLSELRTSAGSLLLPRVRADVGDPVRVRLHAQDVMLAHSPPQDMSTLNALQVTVRAIHSGVGPGVMVQLAAGEHLLLARLTRRAARDLDLGVGSHCYAIINPVAVAPGDIWRVGIRGV